MMPVPESTENNARRRSRLVEFLAHTGVGEQRLFVSLKLLILASADIGAHV